MNHPMSVNANTRVRWSAMQLLPCLHKLRGARVWDAAAGLGFFSAQFAARGAEVLATDIDSRSLAYCARIPGVCTSLLDLDRDDPPQGPFDFIFIGEVLEHIKKPEDFMVRAAQELRIGGTLLLTTPAEEGPLTHTHGKRLGHDNGAEKHERDGFTLGELRSYCEKAGLTDFDHRDCIFFLTELFMQMTKWLYLRKHGCYTSQADVLACTDSFSHCVLRGIYPLLHPIFLAEDALLRASPVPGHCHIAWASKL